MKRIVVLLGLIVAFTALPSFAEARGWRAFALLRTCADVLCAGQNLLCASAGLLHASADLLCASADLLWIAFPTVWFAPPAMLCHPVLRRDGCCGPGNDAVCELR